MQDRVKYGEELKAFVDEGAIRFNIDPLEKLCSVIAARHFVSKRRTDPVTASTKYLIDGLAESKARMEGLGLPIPDRFNLAFHIKTGEVFLWFGNKRSLDWSQLFDAIDYIEKFLERQCQKEFLE